MKNEKTRVVKIHDVQIDSDYAQWLNEIKSRYRSAQIKAAVKVNAEQLLFNWQLGRDLVTRKAEEQWGSGVVEQLSMDLQAAFPESKGFSTSNLWYMKQWYEFYSSGGAQQKLQQLVGEFESNDFPPLFAYVPWGHHAEIIAKCKTIEEALFYEKKCATEGWSRNTLMNCIKALNKAEREGIIIKNQGKDIDHKLKPHAKESTRCYLTLDEVKKIIGTLFCCFSGLRHSDLLKLTWGEIKQTADGQYQIETMMRKTKHSVSVPLSENALSFLPERGEAKDSDRVFPNLPDQPGNADARLKTLIRHAGIDKKVSFHVGRHTFATLTLTYGADLYTVSKLLGHCNIRTTQIYAKIVDENKRKAVNLIPKI